MKKKVLFISAISLAVVTILVGLGFLFFGNKAIRLVPSFLSVEKIDGKYNLVSQFNADYAYKFRLEQYQDLENEYKVITTVLSKSNVLNLSDEKKFDVVAGKKYRFAVCFTNENGTANGDYSKYVEWVPSWNLDDVNYDSVEIENEVITWDEVNSADSYSVSVIDNKGDVVLNAVVQEESFVLSQIDRVGYFKIYIVAVSNNANLLPSQAGLGKSFSVVRKNQILSANFDADRLEIVCNQIVSKFEIYVDGVFEADLNVEEKNWSTNGNNIVYNFLNLSFLDIDFENKNVEIKSSENLNLHILASEKIKINVR